MEQRSAQPTQHPSEPYAPHEAYGPYESSEGYESYEAYEPYGGYGPPAAQGGSQTTEPYQGHEPRGSYVPSRGAVHGHRGDGAHHGQQRTVEGDGRMRADARLMEYTRLRGDAGETAERAASAHPAGDRAVRPRRSPRLPRPAAPAAASAAVAPHAPAEAGRGGAARPGGHRPADAPEGARGGAPGRSRGRLPAPRLTGLGVGVFASLLMVGFGAAFGALAALLPGGAPAFYGGAYVLVCVAAGLWVRPAELFAAPVATPLAYAVGLFFLGGSGHGFTGLLQDAFTGLALHAAWLYVGTLITGLLVLVRRVGLALERRRRRRSRASEAH